MLIRMVLPTDLATHLTELAASQGRSPEAFLREALGRIDESARVVAVPQPNAGVANLQDTAHIRAHFVPQQFGVSVYE